MNFSDAFAPPGIIYLEDELDNEQLIRLNQAQLQALEQSNKRRRRMARQVNDSSSSESEMDQVTNKLNGTRLTPDTATPQELVKLDPDEIGMSSGYKHLYSGKEDKRGRFQWQTTIPGDLGKPVEDAESEKWAIIVRNVKV